MKKILCVKKSSESVSIQENKFWYQFTIACPNFLTLQLGLINSQYY